MAGGRGGGVRLRNNAGKGGTRLVGLYFIAMKVSGKAVIKVIDNPVTRIDGYSVITGSFCSFSSFF